MDKQTRIAVLNAVPLGALMIGTCLPFSANDPSTLWAASSTNLTAAIHIGAIVLGLLLMAGVVMDAGSRMPDRAAH